MDNTRDLEELNKLGVQPPYTKEQLENFMNILTKPSDYLTKPMTLEERPRNWDIQYNSPNSEPVKSRPARPSKEQDELVEEMKTNISLPSKQLRGKQDVEKVSNNVAEDILKNIKDLKFELL